MQNKEVQRLLKNISIALESNSIAELNSCISSILSTNEDKGETQLKIIECVCNEYGISRSTLIKTKSNQKIVRAKRVCCCILHNILGLSTRQIASSVFKLKYHNTVAEAIQRYKNANLKIKQDREYKEEIDNITIKVVQIINK